MWSYLTSWREKPGFGRLEAGLGFLYVVVLALAIPSHEAWADEAQAWLIARDSSLWEIVAHRLHYEGAPPLWHLLLRLFYLAGGSYPGINWLGAVFAVAGVIVLLGWSPFPLLWRILLPFTFFFQYQYAVIARPYTLFPLLVFATCALFPRRERPWAFVAAAGLLASVSMQGVIVSLTLAVLYLWEHRFRRQQAGLRARRPGLLAPALVYLGALLAIGLVVLPAPDVNFFAAEDHVARGTVHDLLVRYIGQPTAKLPFLPQPFTPDLPRPKAELTQSSAGWAVWYMTCDQLQPDCSSSGPTFAHDLVRGLVNRANQATWPISTSKTLACIFLISVAIWVSAMGGFRFLLLPVMLIFLGHMLWFVDHHSGMFLVTILAAVWLARSCCPPERTSPKFDRPFVLLFGVIAALQIGWTASSVHGDIISPYDPGKAAADFLKKHPVPRAAAFGFFSCSMQPYFVQSPFFNQPTSYWRWSSVDNPDAHYHDTIITHPDLVIVTVDFVRPGIMENEWAPILPLLPAPDEQMLPRNPIANDLRANGYHEARRFCGSRFMRMGISMGTCDVFFESGPVATGPAAKH